jgi:hypothetical protein
MFLISGTIGRLMENGLISTSKKSTIQNTQTLLVILLFFGYSIFIMFGGKMTEEEGVEDMVLDARAILDVADEVEAL